jgi:hypothetical protein
LAKHPQENQKNTDTVEVFKCLCSQTTKLEKIDLNTSRQDLNEGEAKMDHENCGRWAGTGSSVDDASVPDDCVCGKADEVELRALKMYVLRSTAERYGGTIEYDLETDTVAINVPKKDIPACTEEVARQLGAAFRLFQSQRPSFLNGFI